MLGAALGASLAIGCAPAVPLLAGGSTAPRGRADVALGGAFRVPFGDLAADAGDGLAGSSPSGAAPVAAFRYGVARGFDVGAVAAGATARIEGRYELVIVEDSTRPVLLFVAGPTIGALEGDGASGVRFGGEGAAMYALEIAGVYDLWIGVRAGIERVDGDAARGDEAGTIASLGATGVRAGPVIGLATGFRRVHALVELSAFYESWSGEHGGANASASGFVLVPAFALRLRI